MTSLSDGTLVTGSAVQAGVARFFRNSEHAVFLISSADFFVFYDSAALRQLSRPGQRMGYRALP